MKKVVLLGSLIRLSWSSAEGCSSMPIEYRGEVERGLGGEWVVPK